MEHLPPQRLKNPIEFGGYTIPAGTVVQPSLHKTCILERQDVFEQPKLMLEMYFKIEVVPDHAGAPMLECEADAPAILPAPPSPPSSR